MKWSDWLLVYSALPKCQCILKKKKDPKWFGQTEAEDEETEHLFNTAFVLMQHLDIITQVFAFVLKCGAHDLRDLMSK